MPRRPEHVFTCSSNDCEHEAHILIRVDGLTYPRCWDHSLWTLMELMPFDFRGKVAIMNARTWHKSKPAK